MPGLAKIMERLDMDGGESLGQAAAALEFALEGLYLMRRLSKDVSRRRRRLPDLRRAAAATVSRRTGTAATSTAARTRSRRRTTCAGAVDALGDVGAGRRRPGRARCATCCGAGMTGQRGLDDLLRRVRERQREIRGRGRLDGILEQARALLDTAIGQERAELFPDPSDDARLREAELDALPPTPRRRSGELADYDWRQPGRPRRPSSSSRSCSGARCWTASSAA